MAQDHRETERELRRLLRDFVRQQPPDPAVPDDELADLLRARLRDGATAPDGLDGLDGLDDPPPCADGGGSKP